MANYNVRIDMPIDAETPKEAAKTMLAWLQDTSDPLLPIVEVMDLDATITIDEFDLGDFDQDDVPRFPDGTYFSQNERDNGILP